MLDAILAFFEQRACHTLWQDLLFYAFGNIASIVIVGVLRHYHDKRKAHRGVTRA